MTTELPTLTAARRRFAAMAEGYGYTAEGVGYDADECELGLACYWLAKVRRSQASEPGDYEAVSHECDALADDDPTEAVRLAAAAVVVAAADVATCERHAASWRSPIKAAADPAGSRKWGDAWQAQADAIKVVADELTATWLTDDDGEADDDDDDGDGGEPNDEPPAPTTPPTASQPTRTATLDAHRDADWLRDAAVDAMDYAERLRVPLDAEWLRRRVTETWPTAQRADIDDDALHADLYLWLTTEGGPAHRAARQARIDAETDRYLAAARQRAAAHAERWQPLVAAARERVGERTVAVTASRHYLEDYADRLLGGGRWPDANGRGSTATVKLRSVDELADLLADADANAELAAQARHDRDDCLLRLARAGERLTQRAVAAAREVADLPARPMPPASTTDYWLVVACQWAATLPRAEGGI